MDLEDLTAADIIDLYLRRALPPLGTPVRVRWITSILPSTEGDVAAFPRPFSERLVVLGVATYEED